MEFMKIENDVLYSSIELLFNIFLIITFICNTKNTFRSHMYINFVYIHYVKFNNLNTSGLDCVHDHTETQCGGLQY